MQDGVRISGVIFEQPHSLRGATKDQLDTSSLGLGGHFVHDRELAFHAGANHQTLAFPRNVFLHRQRRVAKPLPKGRESFLFRFRRLPRSRTTSLVYSSPSISSEPKLHGPHFIVSLLGRRLSPVRTWSSHSRMPVPADRLHGAGLGPFLPLLFDKRHVGPDIQTVKGHVQHAVAMKVDLAAVRCRKNICRKETCRGSCMAVYSQRLCCNSEKDGRKAGVRRDSYVGPLCSSRNVFRTSAALCSGFCAA